MRIPPRCYYWSEAATLGTVGAVGAMGQASSLALGYREAHEFSELDALEAALPGILRATGPVFIDLKIEPGETYPQDWAYMHGAASREKFRIALRQSRRA